MAGAGPARGRFYREHLTVRCPTNMEIGELYAVQNGVIYNANIATTPHMYLGLEEGHEEYYRFLVNGKFKSFLCWGFKFTLIESKNEKTP